MRVFKVGVHDFVCLAQWSIEISHPSIGTSSGSDNNVMLADAYLVQSLTCSLLCFSEVYAYLQNLDAWAYNIVKADSRSIEISQAGWAFRHVHRCEVQLAIPTPMPGLICFVFHCSHIEATAPCYKVFTLRVFVIVKRLFRNHTERMLFTFGSDVVLRGLLDNR